MKKIYILSCLVLLIFSPFKSFSQNNFSEDEIKILNQRVDSIINLYLTYSGFSMEGDNIDESYVDGFLNLFYSSNVKILNDLDPEKQTPQKITVEEYIDYVRDWYNTGLTVVYSGIQHGIPVKDSTHSTISVTVVKDLTGFFKEQDLHVWIGSQYLSIQFTRDMETFKIVSIDDSSSIAGDEACRNKRNIANSAFQSKDYRQALKNYLDAKSVCPNDPSIESQIMICKQKVEELRKPFYITAQFIPGLSGIAVSGGKDITSERGFKYGGGIGFEAEPFKWKSSYLGFGLGINYEVLNFSLSLGSFSDSVLSRDPDGEVYELLYKLEDIKEKDQISYLQIPVYVKYRFAAGRIISVYAKAGVSIGLTMGGTYHSTAQGQYMGRYSAYGNILIFDMPSLGFGSYPIDKGNEKLDVNLLNISVYGGLGLSFRLQEKVDLFLGGEYLYGLSSLTKTQESLQPLSENKDNLNTLLSDQELSASTSMINLEVGIRIRLSK